MSAGIGIVTSPDELADFYSDSPAAHIYALCDLEEPFWSASEWYRDRNAVVGIVRLPDDGFRTAYAVSTRDPEATLDLLEALDHLLEPGLLLTGPTGLADRLSRRHGVAWTAPHLRYELTDRRSVPAPDPRVRPVDRDDLEALQSLYSTDPGAAFFRPSMLDDDSFVGLFEAGELLAAAGTHVLSESRGVAALGSVFTLREHRRRGLGAAVTAGVYHRIANRVSTIGLNVATGNHVARRIYETMGFGPLLPYDEAELR